MNTRLPLLSVLMIIVLSGCRNDPITSTWVAKESKGSTRPGSNPTLSVTRSFAEPTITWTLPAGWSEQDAGAMRVGSFMATGPNGQKVDISVIPLSGPAGGALANINRWRGQINLDPIEENELPRFSETIQVGREKILLVNFSSEGALIDNRYKKRIVAGIATHGRQTWFFKMTGEDQAVQSHRASFLQFLNSLKFPSHD